MALLRGPSRVIGTVSLVSRWARGPCRNAPGSSWLSAGWRWTKTTVGWRERCGRARRAEASPRCSHVWSPSWNPLLGRCIRISLPADAAAEAERLPGRLPHLDVPAQLPPPEPVHTHPKSVCEPAAAADTRRCQRRHRVTDGRPSGWNSAAAAASRRRRPSSPLLRRHSSAWA